MRRWTLVMALTVSGWAVAAAEDASIPSAARAIRTEALLPPRGPQGRPLPLVAHWHRRSMPLAWQIQQIRAGHHMLPWTPFSRDMGVDQAESIASEVRQLAEWGLPFVLLTGGQWEADFYSRQEYKEQPADQTGVGVSASSGNKINAVSPFSPVEPWRDLGRKWTDVGFTHRLQQIYPDPPRVFFVSNNEANDIRWHAAEKLKRYMDRYGEGRSDNFKRKVFGDGWIERYGAMIEGMRSGLDTESWRENSRFVAYNAFGPDHFGRWDGWAQYSLHTEDRVCWSWHAWEGGIPEAYDNHWEDQKRAYRVWSMQTEMMNLHFMQDDAFEANPDFWFEVIFWDGYLPERPNDKRTQYAKDGVEYTPQLYRGWVQYVTWTLTPRVVREWRASAFDREHWEEYFDELVNIVDVVHADPVLRRFWRSGQLVPNLEREHPFQSSVPEKFQDAPRWFHLPTSTDPPDPWSLSTEIPVFSLARVLGDRANREWLVYAHAPKGERQAVTIRIPGHSEITVDVPVEGAFYHVREGDDQVRIVGDHAQLATDEVRATRTVCP